MLLSNSLATLARESSPALSRGGAAAAPGNNNANANASDGGRAATGATATATAASELVFWSAVTAALASAVAAERTTTRASVAASLMLYSSMLASFAALVAGGAATSAAGVFARALFVATNVGGQLLVSQVWSLAVATPTLSPMQDLRSYAAASSYGQTVGAFVGYAMARGWLGFASRSNRDVSVATLVVSSVAMLVAAWACSPAPASRRGAASVEASPSLRQHTMSLLPSATAPTLHQSTPPPPLRKKEAGWGYVAEVAAFFFANNFAMSMFMMRRLDEAHAASEVSSLHALSAGTILAFHVVSETTGSLPPTTSLLVLPLVTALAPVALDWLGTPAPTSLAVLTVLSRTASYAVAKPSREALFRRMSERERARFKPVIDSFVSRAGAAAASAVYYHMQPIAPTSFLVMGAVWFAQTVHLARQLSRDLASSSAAGAGADAGKQKVT